MDKKLRALIDCRNLWAWLAITGCSTKTSYPPAKSYAHECPCCEAAGAFNEGIITNTIHRDCKKCLLNGYAWNLTSHRNCFCEWDRNSLYKVWVIAGDLERQFWAMQMVQACDKAIEDWILEH